MPWLFDIEPAADGIACWVIHEDGRRERTVDPDWPAFLVGRADWRVLARLLPGARIAPARRREFGTDRVLRLWAVAVPPPQFARAVRRVLRALPDAPLYDADFPVEHLWAMRRGVFPLMRAPRDDLGSPDYDLPALRILEIRPDRGRLEVRRDDGQTLVLDEDPPRALAALLREYDPDVVATHGGDAWLVDRLDLAHPGMPWHRAGGGAGRARPPRSYFSYGRVVRSAGARLFYGRWHLDFENSFLLREAGLDGLIEIARLSRMPVPLLARATVGTAISAMEVAQAIAEGYAVPREKRQTESFKSALDLLRSDRGGLTYLPPVGWFANVAELDFASMYPTIMVRSNISPETFRCACCPGKEFCSRRRGLVPRVLEPLLTRRAEYKRRRDAPDATPAQREMYDRRQTALKWVLVTCFGYLGYKNARFGRIECHEAVTARAREILLRAKEAAEERGFRMIHAIVDSLWVHRDGATEQDYRALADAIAAETGMPISLEGVYRWIRFPPSRTDRRVAVHNRYAGAFGPGRLKYRGIELRRHDVPRFVRRVQQRVLEVLSEAASPQAVAALLPRVRRIVEEAEALLREGRVPPEDLAVRQRLSRSPDAAIGNSWGVVAARHLRARGVRLEAGDEVAYLITARGHPDPAMRAFPLALVDGHYDFDADAYIEMLRRAVETVAGSAADGYDRASCEPS